MSRLAQILTEIEDEVRSAQSKFAPFNSPHEGYAVIQEEVDELWDAVKSNSRYAARPEAVQIAAMAVRYLLDLYGAPDTPPDALEDLLAKGEAKAALLLKGDGWTDSDREIARQAWEAGLAAGKQIATTPDTPQMVTVDELRGHVTGGAMRSKSPSPEQDAPDTPPYCDSCGAPKGSIVTEHVDGRGPGWKCSCGYWTWLTTPDTPPDATTPAPRRLPREY